MYIFGFLDVGAHFEFPFAFFHFIPFRKLVTIDRVYSFVSCERFTALISNYAHWFIIEMPRSCIGLGYVLLIVSLYNKCNKRIWRRKTKKTYFNKKIKRKSITKNASTKRNKFVQFPLKLAIGLVRSNKKICDCCKTRGFLSLYSKVYFPFLN